MKNTNNVTIKQQMKENIFVRNNLCDERDGLIDLIFANFGSVKQIREHLFPNAKPKLEEETVDKFVSKYAQWLSKKIDDKHEVEKYVNKDVIRKLLTQELIKRRKSRDMPQGRRNHIGKGRIRHSSMDNKTSKVKKITQPNRALQEVVSFLYV